ncbi:MAG: hypothetical protein WD044_06580 [Dongiaceae bacterium]
MTSQHLSLDFAPLLPWLAIAALFVLALLPVALGAWRRARGAGWRGLAAIVIAGALTNPTLVEEERASIDDVAVVVLDRSQSMRVTDRIGEAEAAADEIARAIEAIPGLTLRRLTIDPDPREADDGTRIFGPLRALLADVPASRLAGVIVVGDGQAHDAPGDPATAGFEAPLHLLLAGDEDEGDRRLSVPQAPSYGVVGEIISMTLRVDDLPSGPGTPVPVSLSIDGEAMAPIMVPPGVDHLVELPVDHAGSILFELEAAPGPQELSLVNNRVAFSVNGVRDRLRVLLISGEPHPGERTWRNILKSDPTVDLVHFTILRPPEKQDNTPIEELSLIAFPIRELFEVKLYDFDLIIFDRYQRRGILPREYFDNIVTYVEQGGALLEASGVSFSGALGLWQTPLARALPGEPTGNVLEAGFRPELSEIGQRHPVTADLPGAGSDGAEPEWGRWFRVMDTVARQGDVLMTGIDERPVLILKHHGEGRVAQLLSDQIWLWSRGFEGGGPQAELLRRIAHWLMKEPALEEETLLATIVDDRLEIERRSLTPGEVEITVQMPDGTSRSETMTIDETGHGRITMPAESSGLYRVGDGNQETFAASGALNSMELADLRASPDRMAPMVEATGGAVVRIADSGVPEIRRVQPDRDAAGQRWIGLVENGDYRVIGIRELPMLPGLLVLALALAATMAAWYRESR